MATTKAAVMLSIKIEKKFAIIDILVSLLLIFDFIVNADSNQEECDKLREPKLLRSCCKISHTDDVIEKCRHDLRKTLPETLRDDKVALNLCIVDCEFIAKSYSNATNALNFQNIETDLQQRHADDANYVLLLMQGFRLCENFAKNRTNDAQTWLQAYNICNAFPAIVLACATEHIYANCPPKKWHNTTECEKMRNFLNKCDIKNYEELKAK